VTGSVQEKLKPRSILGPLNIYVTFALAGLLGPIVLGFADLIAALSASGYSPIRDSISSLALAPMGWLQTIGFLVIGLLMEIFILGLYLCIRRGRYFGLSIGIFVCCSFGLLLIGAFHADPTGAPSTLAGTIHSGTANTVFILFPVVCFLMAPSLRGDTYWKELFLYTIVTGILASILAIVVLLIPDESGWFGLYERILVADIGIWVEVMALWLLRLSIRLQLRS
jgi:hypothetical protein